MTARTWMIRIPAPIRIRSVNGESGPAVSRNRKAWRDTAYARIAEQRIPTGLTRIRVDIELRFPTAARRGDEANYNNIGKPIVDAIGPELRYMRKGTLVHGRGHGIVADDSGRYLHCSDCPHIRFGAPTDRDPRWPLGLVVLTITDVSEASPGALDELLNKLVAERFA